MKTFAKKAIACVLLASMLLVMLQSISFAKSEKVQMIKKGENEYILYVADLLNTEFEFAFSNNSNEDKANLKFQNSAKDSLDIGNNIAYVDNALYEEYFKNKENTYLWIKDESDYQLEAKKIDLSDSLTEDEVKKCNNITKTINAKVGEKELPQENVDGVKITRRINTLIIEDSKLKNLQYSIVKSKPDTDFAKLIELANKLNELKDDNMLNKISTYKQFYSMYEKLMPTTWMNVENSTILQPNDSKENDQYVVFLKAQDENGKTITDLQILTCTNAYSAEFENQKIVKKEVSKMPVTGDSYILIIIAGILVLLIAIFGILKIKNKKTMGK